MLRGGRASSASRSLIDESPGLECLKWMASRNSNTLPAR
jgi:hypothetical protein